MELGLLTPSKQFAEIHVHENNKCAEAILSISDEFHKLDKHISEKTTMPDTEKISISNETISEEIPITLKRGNQSSISLANNPILHTRTKHIDIQHHYIRDEVASGRINLVYTPTGEMLADGLTKPLSHVKFLNFIKQMRME